jgi:hypothetical protein
MIVDKGLFFKKLLLSILIKFSYNLYKRALKDMMGGTLEEKK